MKDKDKIKKQAADLVRAGEMIQMLTDMVVTSTQALRYIAAPPEAEKSKIILLKSIGLPDPQEEVQPANEVAAEALMLLMEIKNGHSRKPDLRVAETPEEVRVADGGEITFTQDFDILYHECCGCGLIHEVELDWDVPLPIEGVKLVTKWTRKDAMPTAEEVQAVGHKVMKH